MATRVKFLRISGTNGCSPIPQHMANRPRPARRNISGGRSATDTEDRARYKSSIRALITRHQQQAHQAHQAHLVFPAFSIVNMKFLALAAVATMAAAHPTQSYGAPTCVVDLNNTPYNQLSLRPTPCNNKQPIINFNNGQPLVNMNYPQQYGCGYAYTYVGYYGVNGQFVTGYVGTDFIKCKGVHPMPPPRPQPQPQPQPQYTQQCGSWSVKNGGPVNSCGEGYSYSAGDNTMCASNGSNCRSACCSPLVY